MSILQEQEVQPDKCQGPLIRYQTRKVNALTIGKSVLPGLGSYLFTGQTFYQFLDLATAN